MFRTGLAWSRPYGPLGPPVLSHAAFRPRTLSRAWSLTRSLNTISSSLRRSSGIPAAHSSPILPADTCTLLRPYTQMQIHTKASSAAAAASTDPDISPEILDTIGTISPEKQFTDQRRLVHKLQEKAAKTRYRRAQPLNETMMRQALDRVSDLHLWEGCQLIEMNPGLGIFSRLLHEKVKPSRHIMLEPNKQFNPILESTLIDNPPGGKENRCEFHLHNFDGYDWKSYQKIIELGSFNPVTTEPQDGLNKNILFVGNLAVKGQDGDRLLTQIVEAMGSGQWIHQYGRVRMLIWIQNHIKIRFLPRAMKDRTRVTATTEIVTDIYELAGAGGPGEDSHWASVVTESLAKLEKNLQELEEARRLQAEQAMKDPEAAARMEEERKQKLKALDGGSKTLAAATIRQRTYTVHDRENFVGRDRKAELEAMYQDPDHEPWTPELEHPPWLYTDPHSPCNAPRSLHSRALSPRPRAAAARMGPRASLS
ncbi:hypothetical protein BDZ91DRAFT_214242 [Kalaharituber pfeilii]|nr:hypothetical protein BDZ91DRAFT_214242 [Kalaharituber pfeilii]